MSAKMLILHVGWPKTGSSSLQVFFARNAEQLKLARFAYPEIFDLSAARRGYGQGNGYSLAYGLLDDRFVTRCNYPAFGLDEFRQLLIDCTGGSVLISTEWFTALSEDALRSLKSNAAQVGCDVKIVGYVRPYISFLNSEYAQGVKIGRIVDRADQWEFSHSVMAVADRFSKVFGRSSVVLRPFVKDFWVGGSLYTDFLVSAGVETHHVGQFVPAEEANQTLAPEVVNMQLGMNILGHSFSQRELALIDGMVRRNYRQNGQRGSWFTDGRLEEIRSVLTPEVEYLTAEYFQGKRFLLEEFEGRAGPVGDGCLNDVVLTLEEERDLLESVYKQMVAAEGGSARELAQALARRANIRLLDVLRKSVPSGL